MKELKIEKIEGFVYYLKDKNDKEYKLNLEFYDLEVKPQVNDWILIYEELLEEEKNSLLSFGALESSYGRKIESSKDKDLLILFTNNQRFYLKRLYG